MLDLTCSVDGRPFPCQFIKVGKSSFDDIHGDVVDTKSVYF